MDLLKKLPQMGLPNLRVPWPNQFFHVDTLPILATGKRDRKSLRELAVRFAAVQKPENKGDV
jgi:hypothetical protein